MESLFKRVRGKTESEPAPLEPLPLQVEVAPPPPEEPVKKGPILPKAAPPTLDFRKTIMKNHVPLDLLKDCWTGIKLEAKNELVKEHFETTHYFEIGRKQFPDPWTGKKEDDKSLYNFSTFLKKDNWNLFGKWTSGLGLISQTKYEKGNFSAECNQIINANGEWSKVKFSSILDYPEWAVQSKFDALESIFKLSFTRKIWNNCFGVQYTNKDSKYYLKMFRKWQHPNNSYCSTIVLGTIAEDLKETPSINHLALLFNFPKFNFLDYSIGLEINKIKQEWESSIRLGYAVKYFPTVFPFARLLSDAAAVRGYLDLTGKVACILEEQMSDFTTFAACAQFDFPKNTYQFGFSLKMIAFEQDPFPVDEILDNNTQQ